MVVYKEYFRAIPFGISHYRWGYSNLTDKALFRIPVYKKIVTNVTLKFQEKKWGSVWATRICSVSARTAVSRSVWRLGCARSTSTPTRPASCPHPSLLTHTYTSTPENKDSSKFLPSSGSKFLLLKRLNMTLLET